MNGYTVKCPICGALNKSLFLEETEGQYECEWCGHTGLIDGYRRKLKRNIRMQNSTAEKPKHIKRLMPFPV